MKPRVVVFAALVVVSVSVSALSAEPSRRPAGGRPAGTSDWSKKNFVHPPLKCMRLYTRIDEYPILAWDFHGRGAPGYNEEYVKIAKACGFNILIDGEIMLKPCEKFEGMKVMVVAFRYSPDRIQKQIFDRFGDHPRLMGFVLDDNCPRIYGWSIKASNFLRQKYPHTVPWISENPDPRGQARTAMRILGTQNYHVHRGGGGGWSRQAYCSTLGRDRDNGNRSNMSFWPLFSAPASTSEIRFQAFAAAAHGAQGICYFAFSPGGRWPQWKPPNGSNAKAAAYANGYLTKVAGRYIWGTRCMAVLHAPRDGDVPRNAGRAGPAQIIEDMDPAMLAGLLLPEKDFYAKVPEGRKKVPLYAFVVDKRISRRDRHGPRTGRVSFAADVKLVEVFPRLTGTEKDRIRVIEPSWGVPLHLLAGDALLLRLNPEGVEDLFGGDGKAYMRIIQTVGKLRQKIRDGRAAIAEFNQTLAVAGRAIAGLKAATDKISRGLLVQQRHDMLDRLTAQIDHVRDKALQVRVVSPPGFFAGKIAVELAGDVKGAEIRYTTDGAEVTLESKRYAGPIPISAAVKIRARAVDTNTATLVGKEAAAEFKQVKGHLTGSLQVNFGPPKAATPKGMLADHGDGLKTHENGWTYGWDRNMAKQMKASGAVKVDPAKDTFVFCAPNSRWEIVLENGTYDVTISLGNAKAGVPHPLVVVEGKLLGDKEKMKPGEFKTWTAGVKVADGRLTVQSHGLGWKWQNRINWIKIRRK